MEPMHTRKISTASHSTPRQPKGPFYPVNAMLDSETDLTSAAGFSALGERAFVMGRVYDAQGLALAGVTVEIWQACESGKYDHPDDPNMAAFDPGFKYSGRALTGSDGAYLFKTIVPGAYPADIDWMRPPHIHFRVFKEGYVELITQMYFAGHALNEVDEILQMLPKEEQGLVVIRAQEADRSKFGPDAKLLEFDLTLLKIK
jgi:protocatechuate 3,4-dioxygenase beta subunit